MASVLAVGVRHENTQALERKKEADAKVAEAYALGQRFRI